MPEYATSALLQRFAREKSPDEQIRLRRTAANRTLVGSTFLSHSSKDEDLVIGAITVLEGHGARVYIDRIDPQMPPYTSSETAALLKTRIQQTTRFVVLVSENSNKSKWVPWELGIADGVKGISRIALFPSVEETDRVSWTSSEYLGLYPRIAWGRIRNASQDGWMVWDQLKEEALPLKLWLSSG